MQLRLSILSNAGGSGKTTLAVHLAYLLARKKLSVALMDLDPQGSVSLFCGLPQPNYNQTIGSALAEKKFSGDWPLVELWKNHNVKRVHACQGELALVDISGDLARHPRGAYLLSDMLTDYPLPQDVILFDCPATLGTLPLAAISASTHILIPIQLEPKSTGGASSLLKWLYDQFTILRLHPQPKILGVIPNQFDHRLAIHRNILEELVPLLESMNIQCFEPIRFSSEFKNSSAVGLPLHLYRSKHPACKDFTPITDAVRTELKNKGRL